MITDVNIVVQLSLRCGVYDDTGMGLGARASVLCSGTGMYYGSAFHWRELMDRAEEAT